MVTATNRRAAPTKSAGPSEPAPALSVAADAAPAVPKAVGDKLEKLGVRRRLDLVLHLPLRYEDETTLARLSDAMSGETVQLECEVEHTSVQFRPKRTLVCKVRDGDEILHLRFFNFYPSQQKQLAPGTRLRLIGELRKGFFGAEMVHPRYRVVRSGDPLPQALTPVYPSTAGLAQALLRKLVEQALDEVQLADTLPSELITELQLPSFKQSIVYLHNPPTNARLDLLQERTHPAWRRIKFDELLAQQLSMRLHHRRRQTVTAPRLGQHRDLPPRLLAALPFALTRAQQRALREIRADLQKAHPMQRLLQGDVGSGKTVVAALAAMQAVESGYQVAVMAPTEILAEQHYRKFASWVTELGVKLSWLAGGLRKREKTQTLAEVAEGATQIAVGTHALFQEEVRFAKLGLAIVDEQHRFGVHQRLALSLKGTDTDESTHP